MKVEPGYYTVQRGDDDVTVCWVAPEDDRRDDEVEILRYTPGWKVDDVFGGETWKILDGPWSLPGTNDGIE
jgi:hypothetical protein